MQSYEKKRLGLYVHVPFCRSKCAYCDFFSVVPPNAELTERYVNALILHMQSYRRGARDYAPDTVYIGGGTPTSLEPDLLIRLIRAIRRNFSLVRGAEFTVEANPATVELNTLNRLRRLGVNRLSMGLQSANNRELAALSRIHRREDFEASFRLARRARIDNINVDLMFGIPYQTRDSLMKSLRYVVRLGPEHISLYDLILEPGTPLDRQRATLPFPNEDEEAEMYLMAVDFLAQNGYAQYEISNFARPGYQCRHNLKYWNCDEYLGFGPSAYSYFNSNRFSFVRNIEAYMRGVEDLESRVGITVGSEEITGRAQMGEYVMLRLRLRDGIGLGEFRRRFGCDFTEMYGEKLGFYLKRGYMAKRGDSIFLTPAGMFVSNYILSDILSFADLNALSPANNF